jgi:hypothetical protein
VHIPFHNDRTKGVAFVEFQTRRDAREAIRRVTGLQLQISVPPHAQHCVQARLFQNWHVGVDDDPPIDPGHNVSTDGQGSIVIVTIVTIIIIISLLLSLS